MENAVESPIKENAEAEKPTNNKVEEKSPPPHEQQKKSKREDRNKKDDKNVEQFMKSLNSLPTLEEKLSLVCKKYVQTADDNKKMLFYMKQSDKRYALLLKEKDQLQHEFNKTILLKSKLENLCRELQKQNKAIKEDSLLKIREEEERRKETQAKFQATLAEITAMLQQNNDKNNKLRDDNISMTEKFKSVVTQYQMREQQVDKMQKQLSLETQLSDAKMQKASLEHQAEKGRLLAEMETLKMELCKSEAKIEEMKGTEVALRSQIAVYTEKYDEFQNALVKSNQVFGGFKGEMDKMSKKILKLEKESLSWKKRWETSQTALIDMCSERQTNEQQAAASARHLQQMQALCRTLQGERTVLLNVLKEHNIERPAMPPAPPAPAPAPAAPSSSAKVDAMAANCAQLKQSLAHLQNQLNVLTTQKEEKQPETPKAEKKKSKSKKNKGEKAVEKQENNENEAKSNVDNNTEAVDVNANDNVKEIAVDNLIQAISQANISLADLDGDSDEVQNGNVEVETKVENGVDKVPKICEIASKAALNDSSFVEPNSNEEVAHIPEIKSLTEEPTEQVA
ncbi:hypothetical protein JYU34_004879 [Plutella xylostella]|uniref:Alpha-taxilin n=1 Tax=Plutella xylostella TaxID=51655 RepID=A0ABQ7QVD3_PLUXY|nr:hypothetical protein JYU34_004879 [Plutella xylostella]